MCNSVQHLGHTIGDKRIQNNQQLIDQAISDLYMRTNFFLVWLL